MNRSQPKSDYDSARLYVITGTVSVRQLVQKYYYGWFVDSWTVLESIDLIAR
jgi:hypothetical protein